MLARSDLQEGTMGALRLVARRDLDAYLPETPSTNDAALMLLASLAADQRISSRGRVNAACEFAELVRQGGVTLEEAARILLDLRNTMPAEAFVPEGFSVTGFLTMVSCSMAWPKALRRKAARALDAIPIRRG
jgi:hypothetical protein